MVKFHLSDGYRFPGYKAYQKVEGTEEEPSTRVITLKRVQKKRDVRSVGNHIGHFTTERYNESVTYHVVTWLSTSSLKGGEHGVDTRVW